MQANLGEHGLIIYKVLQNNSYLAKNWPGKRRNARLLVHPGQCLAASIVPLTAWGRAITEAFSDDAELLSAIRESGAPLF